MFRFLAHTRSDTHTYPLGLP